MTAINSPLRYPGGKARVVKRIMPLIPKNRSEYREPFLGGASVFIAFKKENPNVKCWINDLNRDVYSFWRTLQERPDELIESISKMKNESKDGKTLYFKLAKAKPSSVFDRALRFYVLNRITYSGISDSGGYSNESFEKRFTFSKIEGLKPLSKLLNKVRITNKDYNELLSKKGDKGTFIFLDPPYWKPRNSPLYGKNGDLNRYFDHETFARNVERCRCDWLITCDNSSKMRKLFPFALMKRGWEFKYNGLNKPKAIIGKELFISNYDIGSDSDS